MSKIISQVDLNRINQLYTLINVVGKSGYCNIEPIIEELVRLHGLDVRTIMKRVRDL